MFRRYRRTLQFALATLIFVWVDGLAQSQALMKFDLPAQSLADALRAVGSQTHVNVLFDPPLVAGRRALALKAELTADQAFTQLLAGTNIAHKFLNESTVVLAAAPASSKTPAKESSEHAHAPSGTHSSDARSASETMRLAQAATAASDSGPTSAAAEEAERGSASDVKGMPEILVSGRSLNVDIERTRDAPQPYVVFSRKEIQRSQEQSLGDFFKNRLPMNTESAGVSTGLNTSTTGNSGTYSNINLRGLGANQTLILIDGRRLPSRAVSGTPNQPDINGIPLDAVERIEVLPSTAGGIYGGSATGGVINIILRRDYTGIETRAEYVNTFDANASNLRFEATAGVSLEGGRTRVMLSGTHLESSSLLIGDRDFTARGLAKQLQNNPAAITGLSTAPLGSTVNILSTTLVGGVRQPLTLDPQYGSTPLGATFTHLPLGYGGVASDNGAALVANAGTYDLALPNDLNGRRRGLIGTPRTESVSLNIRREFTSWLEAFIDGGDFEDKGRSAVSGITSSVSLAANAPNNPFQQNINVRFPTPGLQFEQENDSTVKRATGGVIFHLPHQWSSEVDYGWGRSSYRAVSISALDSAGTAALASGRPAADGRPALDVLQEGNTYPIDFTPYLLPLPTSIVPTETTLDDVTARASGPLFDLPGGPLNVAMLVERRTETLEDTVFTSVSAATRQPTYSFYPHRSQRVDSYYLETNAPLISARNELPFVHDLALQASVRHDEYETRQQNEGNGLAVPSLDGPFPPLTYLSRDLGSTDYTFGIKFAPLRDVTLRASYGTGFLPPNVSQIVRSVVPQVTFSSGTDPKRGNTDMVVTGVPWDYVYGGNPDLQPELSKSWSFGTILTPRFVPGLRLSIDYTRIHKENEIQIPPPQFILDNEDLFPGRVQRGPKLPGDPADWAGPITALDTSLLNIARTQVDAVDVQADYSVQTSYGQFDAYLLGTFQPHYSNQALPTSAAVDRAGYLDGMLKWRGNAGLVWTRGPWAVSWNSQYFDSYYIYASDATTTAIATAVLNQGAAKVPSQLYHDVLGTYRIGKHAGWALLANTEISVGIQNVFDRSPPILAITTPSGAGYSTYGDPRLRRYAIGVRKSFD
jgi:outer membrane receptor protein involved in Fe transport